MALLNSTARFYAEEVDRALDARVRGSELVVLAAHRDASVRAAVASRPDAPMATLIFLAHERDERVLEALALNPSSPDWVLRQISLDRRLSPSAREFARLRVHKT